MFQCCVIYEIFNFENIIIFYKVLPNLVYLDFRKSVLLVSIVYRTRFLKDLITWIFSLVRSRSFNFGFFSHASLNPKKVSNVRP